MFLGAIKMKNRARISIVKEQNSSLSELNTTGIVHLVDLAEFKLETKYDAQVSGINHFLNLLNGLLQEEKIRCIPENKRLHLKPINTLIIEINNIMADTSISDKLKITRICILIEGLTGYLKQFGLDTN